MGKGSGRWAGWGILWRSTEKGSGVDGGWSWFIMVFYGERKWGMGMGWGYLGGITGLLLFKCLRTVLILCRV